MAQLSGLTAETTYYARVKAFNSENEESAWSKTVNFTPTKACQLTVNDGTDTNDYVPIYGYYADETSKSQFIIPATDLAAMQYGTITKLTFYASEENVSWGNAEFEVYMTETSATTLSGPADYDSMKKVMSAGSLSISDNKMEVTLDNPYMYLGGNLMIGILQTVSGTYSRSYWYGVNQTSNTAIGNVDNSGTSQEVKQFLPKITFGYLPVLELADNATDNSTTISSYNGQEVGVKLQGRTLYKDGGWNTLYLPFALTAEQVETVLESPTALMALDVTSTESDGTTYKTRFDGSTLYLQFAEATSISPRVPYIIKWEDTTGTIEDPLFSGVTIDVTSLAPTYASADGKVTFTGSFDYQSFTTENKSILFLGDESTLYFPQPDLTDVDNPVYPGIGACRAYFQLASGVTAGDPANAIRAFVLNFGDSETTGINSLTPDPSPRGEGSGYYTLDGRKLDGQPTKKGLYIHGNKVVVIK